MRQFASRYRSGISNHRAAAKDQVDDAVIRERINRSMRRRMSDDLVSLIRRACLCDHAETAKGLWLVLRDLTAREARARFPNGRMPDDKMIETLALEIAAAQRNKSIR